MKLLTHPVLNIKLLCLCTILIIACEDKEVTIEYPSLLVDFSEEVTDVKSVSGFLHGIGDSNPPDSLIAPMQPMLWRTIPDTKINQRLTNLGAKQVMVLSDLFKDLLPFQDSVAYRTRLITILEGTKDLDVVYDIWNEPDVGFSWQGTEEQFFQTFKLTHDLIREHAGKNAIISGPSSHWLPDYLHRFIKYCKDHQVQLDVLSWHEFQYNDNFHEVKEHLQYARKYFVDNQRYEQVGIQEIHINEYGRPEFQQTPAAILAYLFFLEEGGVDGACRASWFGSNHENSILTSLVANNLNWNKRTAWWIYRTYANSIDSRVRAVSSSDHIAAFAHRPTGTTPYAEVIVANYKLGLDTQMKITLNNLSSISIANRPYQVEIYRILDNQDEAIDQLEPVKVVSIDRDQNSQLLDSLFIPKSAAILLKIY